MSDDEEQSVPSNAGRNLGETFENCAHCGTELSVNEWHPTVTTTDEQGELEVYSFCDDECKEAWSDE